MKKIQLINDDYIGRVNHIRHACRGIVVKDDQVLLGYHTRDDIYIIPGGGVEGDELYRTCCERELLEETGLIVEATDCYLETEELYEDWRHINHYFVCHFIEDTGRQKLTEGEKKAGCTCVWMPVEEALSKFGEYEKYRKDNLPVYGLYRREYNALAEYMKLQNN